MASVYGSSLDGEEIDFSGLVESTVDSDEEDLAESMDVSLIIIIQPFIRNMKYAFNCLHI